MKTSKCKIEDLRIQNLREARSTHSRDVSLSLVTSWGAEAEPQAMSESIQKYR